MNVVVAFHRSGYEGRGRRTGLLFLAHGDGRELYRSPGFAWDSLSVDIEVRVADVKTLRLEVRGTGLGDVVKSIDWAEVRLEK